MATTEHSDLEQQIIKTAQQLFIEKGFVETSMSDIAATVGINRPESLCSTFPYFGEAIFVRIIPQRGRNSPVEEVSVKSSDCK